MSATELEATHSHGIHIFLAGDNFHVTQSLNQIQLLRDLLGRANDFEGEEGGRTSAAVCKQRYPLVLQGVRLNSAQQTGEATVERPSVHVSATLCAGQAWFNATLVHVFGDGDKSLLDRLVAQ